MQNCFLNLSKLESKNKMDGWMDQLTMGCGQLNSDLHMNLREQILQF